MNGYIQSIFSNPGLKRPVLAYCSYQSQRYFYRYITFVLSLDTAWKIFFSFRWFISKEDHDHYFPNFRKRQIRSYNLSIYITAMSILKVLLSFEARGFWFAVPWSRGHKWHWRATNQNSRFSNESNTQVNEHYFYHC